MLIYLLLHRAFDNDEVLHVDDSVDPVRDLGKCFILFCLAPLTVMDANNGYL